MALVRRFVRHTRSGGTVYDVMWTDRMTGKIVLCYDGADPANHDPPDEDVLMRKGLNVDERIDEKYCVCPVPRNQFDADAEAEWEDYCG